MNSPSIRDNILTVGHPLTSSLTHTGFLIFSQPEFNYFPLKNGATRSCALYSQGTSLGDSDLDSNNLIILWRPKIFRNGPILISILIYIIIYGT